MPRPSCRLPVLPCSPVRAPGFSGGIELRRQPGRASEACVRWERLGTKCTYKDNADLCEDEAVKARPPEEHAAGRLNITVEWLRDGEPSSARYL